MARTAFFGTPAFALPSLEALAAASELVLVVAQPDKPSGRGQALGSPPTVEWARAHGIRILQPAKAKDPVFLAEVEALKLDLAVVVAYGKILPAVLLAAPRLGCVNVHASLLPKYRGAAPIQWAIAQGEAETGITLMQLDEGMDTGPMLAVERLSILPDDTGGSLAERLAGIGGRLLAEKLPEILAETLPKIPQDNRQASLAPKLTRADAVLDFRRPAAELHNRVRAFQPWPGALLQLPPGASVLKVWKTTVVSGEGEPGTVLSAGRDGLTIAAAKEALSILEVQPEGKKRMAIGDYLVGHPVALKTSLLTQS